MQHTLIADCYITINHLYRALEALANRPTSTPRHFIIPPSQRRVESQISDFVIFRTVVRYPSSILIRIRGTLHFSSLSRRIFTVCGAPGRKSIRGPRYGRNPEMRVRVHGRKSIFPRPVAAAAYRGTFYIQEY